MLKLYRYHKLRFFSIFLKKTLDKAFAMCYTVIVAGEENKTPETTWNGSLAQLGEHLPYKQRVIGSSPIGPTIWGNSRVAKGGRL